MQINLYYAGEPGDGFGWGVCNRYLIQELSKLCFLTSPDSFISHQAQEVAQSPKAFADCAVFMPLADHDFNPIAGIRGTRNFAYTFFESELGPNAAANAAKYDVVFCGSTWCLERMKERGITNGRVLIQGVDHDIFKPQPVTRNDNEFRIFSGGKFEYRKGQDIVIAAFRELSKKYDNMRLVCAWHNPWPQLIQGMKESPHLTWVNPIGLSQTEFIQKLVQANGIDPAKVTVLPSLSQQDLAAVMNQTDLGVFPNRCEGGTNLVLMEYMACGKIIVASHATGHCDILAGCHGYWYRKPDYSAHWHEPTIDEVVGCIENAFHDRDYTDIYARRGVEVMQKFTWERAARTILDAVLEFQ